MPERNSLQITKGSPAMFPELRGNLANLRWPCFAEIKYDGEATLIGFHDAAPIPIFTCNKYGTMRKEWSKLDQIADILRDKGIKRAMFLAELIYGKGKLRDLYNLLSHKYDDSLNLKIFDVCFIESEEETMHAEQTQLIERKEKLGKIFEATPYLPDIKLVNNKDEAEAYFSNCIYAGYEGIVLKSLEGFLISGPCDWVKRKFKDRTEYTINRIDTTRERIEILIPLPLNQVSKSVQSKICSSGFWYVVCGVKVINRYKKYLKVGDRVLIEHQGVLDSGSLRHPVYIPPLTIPSY